MNIVDALIARIEERRAETKVPCKSYATKEAAEKALSAEALRVAQYFSRNPEKELPARYIVAYNEAWGRWVGGIDLTEVLQRPDRAGGYLGISTFFCY